MAEQRLDAPAPALSAAPAVRPTVGDVHLLRLVLDLQLDALLISLGAASRTSLGSSPSWAARWRSWLQDDVHTAQLLWTTLADTDVDGHMPRPGPGDADAAADDLRESLAKIQDLLTELSQRPTAAAWHTTIQEALSRRHTQLATMPSAPPRAAVNRGGAKPQRRGWAPGELLG
jgi:hypothetical protein